MGGRASAVVCWPQPTLNIFVAAAVAAPGWPLDFISSQAVFTIAVHGSSLLETWSRPNLNPFAVLCVLRGEISTQRTRRIPLRSQSLNKTRTLPETSHHHCRSCAWQSAAMRDLLAQGPRMDPHRERDSSDILLAKQVCSLPCFGVFRMFRGENCIVPDGPRGSERRGLPDNGHAVCGP